MLKIAFILAQTLLIFELHTQERQDELVTFSGKLVSKKDSSALTASVLYEKLPYYDDMGLVSSKEDGTFIIPLIKGQSYIFSVSKSGFKDFSKQISIQPNGKGLFQSEVFYLDSDGFEVKLESLIFSRSSPTIAQSSYQELNELAEWLNQNPSVILQLEGHTDFRGNATANMQLSQARVDAVKEYLVDQNVKKNRILTKAFGGTQPLSKENTEEAKARNRRVEVRVIQK